MRAYKVNWCLTWGAVVAAAGALLTAGWPTLFYSQLRRMMVLANGSMSFDIWQEIPIPIFMECYLYNISNVDDILAGKNVKIRVQQMGPYVFREIQTKMNIAWHANSTVSYETRRRWYFQPERSNGSLSDIITNINPIIPTIAYVLRHENIMLQMMANMIVKLYHSNMFLSGNASSWLFDGIEDPILAISSKIPSFPYNIPFDRFGWLYTIRGPGAYFTTLLECGLVEGLVANRIVEVLKSQGFERFKRNGSSEYDGLFVVNTGADDFSQLGKMELWNHSNQTVYPGSCGEVRGSTGELWAPKIDQSEISLFASDICTTLTLPSSGPVTVGGVEGMLFVSNDSLFDNGQIYPTKACYCEDSPDDCMLSGAMNVSACRYGAPAFATLPHFLHVHPYYADKIDGMEPSGDHEFKMAIEMVTGMPLMVLAQLQVNILVRHSSWMSISNQLPDPDVLVPMFWFREQVFVDDKYASFANLALDIHRVMPYVFYTITAVGAAVLLAGLWTMKRSILRRKSFNAETQIFLQNNECNSNCQSLDTLK